MCPTRRVGQEKLVQTGQNRWKQERTGQNRGKQEMTGYNREKQEKKRALKRETGEERTK